jgi:hypothetical protein
MELKYSHDPTKKAGKELGSLTGQALKAIQDKGHDRQYRQTGQKAVNAGMGVFLKGQVKAAFGGGKEPERSASRRKQAAKAGNQQPLS